jgi:ABC-type multidrug transport system ATPase subunit
MFLLWERKIMGWNESESKSTQRFEGFEMKAETMSFSFENMGLEVVTAAGKKKSVLDGVTGQIKHSQLVAVMGPSGAGKTTFMNALCGRAYYGKTTGTIKINGESDEILRHRKRVGFVPQDDIVHDDLTVRELRV